jgi:HJR/Mrr/RecB family endonuclease
MNVSLIDILILSLIFAIAGYYGFLRYKEEKHKEKINYIPMLERYKKKYLEEIEKYKKRVEKFQEMIKQNKKELEEIKKNIHRYKWTKSDIEKLEKMKKTEFERTFTVLFEILGFNIYEPVIFKENNIDIIIEAKGEGFEKICNSKTCIDFIDFQNIKKIDKNYLEELLKGKEKYKCEKILIMTNGNFPEELRENFKNDIEVFTIKEILQFFPSIKIVYDYDENQTVYHNLEIMFTETKDEITRRKHWISEIEENIEKAKLDFEKEVN